MTFIRSIREMLCFKADSASGRESGTVSAFKAIVPIGCIDLDTRFSGVNLHAASSFRFNTFSSKAKGSLFAFIEYIAMIIAGTKL